MGLLMTGLGAAAGAMGNTQAARTSRSSGTSGNRFGSSVRRTLLPEQQDALAALRSRAGSLMTNPAGGLAPFRQAASNAVNNSFAGADTSLRARFLGSGANRSGKYGRAARLTETARLGKLADVDNQIGQMALAREDEGSALLERLLNMNFGSESSGGNESSFSQTGVAPGSAAAGGIGGGLATFQGLLNQLLMAGRE